MNNTNAFDIQNIVFTSVILPIVISIITATLYNKFYFKFNKNRLQEELRLHDSPQVSLYYINSEEDRGRLIEQAYGCSNYTVTFDVIQNEAEQASKVQCKINDVEIINLDCDLKWIYLYIKNNSNIDVSFVEIVDRQGAHVNISSNWNKHLIEPGMCMGILTKRYDKPTKVILDFNGSTLEYEIGNTVGTIPLKLK